MDALCSMLYEDGAGKVGRMSVSYGSKNEPQNNWKVREDEVSERENKWKNSTTSPGPVRGEIRLMLGTDAASEGLNLQRLSTLINLDLPWNPTRLEQRKGRIQRIGQIHDKVYIYNLRYKDSVEDRVHALLSERLEGIYKLFGQIPDILEDVWVAVALGEKERAKKIIDELPETHPFELRYTNVEKVEWESCRRVLDDSEKKRVLVKGW